MKDDKSSPNFTFLGKDGKETFCVVHVAPGKDNTPTGVYTIAMDDGRGARLLLVAEKYQNWFRGIVTKDGARAKRRLINKEAKKRRLIKRKKERKGGKVPSGNRVLLVILFEAARFPAVFKKCLDLLENMGAMVGDDLEELITDWGDTSFRFYKANGLK
ncbi:uncharacterized protein C2845_PM05G13920 [Panicum miliaceum]|uniref:Uncharacterized protein n=1 Tax=Panicum miliaceum TaxID=4540 RepID=A0A3L6T4M0_PANMI|nr:uncharacterized protein C2845_PM05G13920 [Panicum miliaceum]